jgi:glycosyltransferase involved in cell wall biosynthesis
MPTYCRREYLCEALESVLRQTYDDFEVIVGNDGGTTYIAPVKRQFRDERIVWVDHNVRKGLLGNVLDGFGRARGRYVATLHDDDRWEPALLGTLIQPLESDPALSVAFCDHFIIDKEGRVDFVRSDQSSVAWGRDRLAAGVHRPFEALAIIEQALPVQCAAVFRRDALDLSNFPNAAGTYYDLWLARQLARGGAGAYYVPRRLASIRIHPDSQSSVGRWENARSGIYLHRLFLNDPELAHLPRRPLRRKLAVDHYGVGVSLIRDGRRRPARRHLVTSLALYARARTGLALVASLVPPSIGRRL